MALAAVAGIGFAGVSGVMAVTRSHETSSSQAQMASTQVHARDIAASSPRGAVSSASFPPGSQDGCLGLNNERRTVEDPDVAQASGGGSSCKFLVRTKGDVWQHEKENPGEDTYALAVLSEYRKAHHEKDQSDYVDLSCTHGTGVTTCVGGNPRVTIYVRQKS